MGVLALWAEAGMKMDYGWKLGLAAAGVTWCTFNDWKSIGVYSLSTKRT